VDGALDVLVHRPVVPGAVSRDGLVNLADGRDALAVLVVGGFLEVVLGLFEMLDGTLVVLRFLKVVDGLVHFGLEGVDGGAECEGADGGEEGLDGSFHGVVF
jgi:hypothetical protein